MLVADTDASSDPAKAAELNRMEKLRDPSHVRAMPRAELMDLFRSVGLPDPRLTQYRLESELEGLLSRSFPLPGDADKIRALFTASLEDDRLGLPLRREQNQIHLAYPIAVPRNRSGPTPAGEVGGQSTVSADTRAPTGDSLGLPRPRPPYRRNAKRDAIPPP